MTNLTEPYCNGTGKCLLQITGNTYEETGCEHKCKPIPCLICSKPIPKWLLSNACCVTCNMVAVIENTLAFQTIKNKWLCNYCSNPLNPKFHREDFENSKKPWVRDHIHKRCKLELDFKNMGSNLDDEESDID